MRQKALVLISTLACLLGCTGRLQARVRIFVPNATDNTVSVIDDDVDREIRTIEVGMFPQAVAVRQNPPLLAVGNSRSHSVTLIDPVSLDIIGKEIPAGRYPVALAFSPDGKYLYSSSYDDETINVVDVDLRKQVGEPIHLRSRGRRLWVSPDGARLFAIIYSEPGSVAVIDPLKRAVEKEIAVGKFPTGMAVSPDGKRMFVAAFKTDTLTVIDLENLQAIETYDFRVGNGLLIHPVKPLLYSLETFENRVWVFDYAAKKHVADIPIGQEPLYSVLTPDGRFLYAVNSTDGNVSKIDTETNKVLLRIAVGVEPSDAAVFEMPVRISPYIIVLAAVGVVLVLTAISVLLRRSERRRQA